MSKSGTFLCLGLFLLYFTYSIHSVAYSLETGTLIQEVKNINFSENVSTSNEIDKTLACVYALENYFSELWLENVSFENTTSSLLSSGGKIEIWSESFTEAKEADHVYIWIFYFSPSLGLKKCSLIKLSSQISSYGEEIYSRVSEVVNNHTFSLYAHESVEKGQAGEYKVFSIDAVPMDNPQVYEEWKSTLGTQFERKTSEEMRNISEEEWKERFMAETQKEKKNLPRFAFWAALLSFLFILVIFGIWKVRLKH